ncbi:MAG: two-component system, OmpR family, phosphate regulon sensor histidine kinase PhoR [Deferribacteres bacterium]|jgi:signal transduction histidine kinase|nr:sensor signal transduction histidine kinase [Deferribacteraceae bacterium]MDK2792896.1 two-component system, OmpR family, phosphate regulon sensor histidine kinase PhoR [Deferribacteres bacterium]
MKILYIEDDRTNIFLLKKTLEKYNVDFISCTSGEEGLNLYFQENPDIVLIDINLPGLGGLEIARIIRKNDKITKLVAVSASSDEDDKIIAQALGFNLYIEKPIDPTTFFKQITEDEFDSPLQLETRIVMEKYTDKLIESLKQKVEELTETNKVLMDIDKLKSNFISIASHELRTPLVPLMGYLEIILDKKKDNLPKDIMEYINNINKAAEKLNMTVNKILDMARLERGLFNLDYKKVSVVDLIEKSLTYCSPYMKKRNIGFNIDVPDKYIKCDFDKTVYAITQVFLNAIKFSFDNSKVDIIFDDKSNTLSVRDYGTGINEEELKEVFKPFFALNDISHHHSSDYEFQGKGIGLGLAIAKGFITIQKGKIWVESKGKGTGSTFYIQLPE